MYCFKNCFNFCFLSLIREKAGSLISVYLYCTPLAMFPQYNNWQDFIFLEAPKPHSVVT